MPYHYNIIFKILKRHKYISTNRLTKQCIFSILSIFQNGNECFGGHVDNFYQEKYEKKNDRECNASCGNNAPEKCGRHGRISIYTTNTGKV